MTTLSKSLKSIKEAKFSTKVREHYLIEFILTIVWNLVSRISGKTEVHKLQIELDVCTDIYPMKKDSYYALVLANSLTADGAEEFDLFRHGGGATDGGADQGSNLIDQYQYVMHGKIFEDKLSGENKEEL